MKHFLLSVALLAGSMIYAQEVKPTLVQKGNLVQATFFHDNGVVAQEGFYQNGKLHGEWTMYDQQGEKIAMGTYQQGKRTGKWFFWSEESLKEVDFVNNKVAKLVQWNTQESLASNQK
jgi:antitoxin component YwqK of YwqJK toxin-antitoxin module